jgi:hypothetical protein
MKFVKFLKKPNVLFIIAFLAVSITYNYIHIFELGPRALHIWRQSDCLSITLNYYQHGMNFFEPEIHNLIADDNTTGKTIGEFPLFYYLVAGLWKLFGVHEWIFRFAGLLLVFWGLFSLFKTGYYFLRDTFWALWIPLMLFTSPIFADYGVSFLTNVPALSLVLVAFRYIQLYYEKGKNGSLYLAMLFFALAGLLKTSSLIGFFLLFVVFFGERIIWFNRSKVYLFKRATVLIPMFLVILVVFAWYYYAEWFNGIHKGHYTFNHLWPIWELSKEQIFEYFVTIKKFTVHLVFNAYTLVLFLLMFLTVLLTPRKNSGFFYYGLIILFGGSLIYSLFWFAALNFHDYYYVDLLFLIIFVPFSFLIFLKNNYEQFLRSKGVKVFFALVLIFNVYYTSKMLELRYFPKDGKPYTVIPSEPKLMFKWTAGNFARKYKALEEIQPYFEKIGINQDDRVISVPDGSFNVTLYLMNHPGWTEYGLDKSNLKRYIARGAKYLIINDTTVEKENYLKPYLATKIGSYKNVEIFRLR